MSSRPNNKPSFANRVLAGIRPADLSLLLRDLEPLELKLKQDLERPNKTITYAYFPESGIASVVVPGPGKARIEVGLIGRDGMTGIALLLGEKQSPHEIYMQVAGHGYRLPAKVLKKATAKSAKLRMLMLRYANAFRLQSSQTALVNARLNLSVRLARWLLMAHDRVDGHELQLTHEFLALMLATRRPGVTEALHILEGEHLIQTGRRNITIRDRRGLEKKAAGYYTTV